MAAFRSLCAVVCALALGSGAAYPAQLRGRQAAVQPTAPTAPGQPPAGQSPEMRIAAVVNDEVISVFDMVTRMRLVMSSSNIPDTPETRQRIGAQVLQIWNARVDAIRDKFKEVRTVVLLKPPDFAGGRSPFTVFEFETLRYPVDGYGWRRNANGNFVGFDKRSGEHKFTWQRHGSQFTIKEPVPETRLRFFVKKPEQPALIASSRTRSSRASSSSPSRGTWVKAATRSATSRPTGLNGTADTGTLCATTGAARTRRWPN